ncbi:hypothetical protein ACO0QE_003936 [Hanseniaspora vineae]
MGWLDIHKSNSTRVHHKEAHRGSPEASHDVDKTYSTELNNLASADTACFPDENEEKKIQLKEETEELLNYSVSNDESNLSQTEEPHYYEGWRLVVVQASLNLILFIAALDIVIVTSAIEKISEQFHDYSKSAWIITGYSLPSAVCCLIWSRIAQKLGKKLSVALAVVVFEVGSLIVAVANSMNMLIGGRVIAGIAGSGIQTLMYLVGATVVPESKRPIVFSILSFSFTVSSVLGPFIGGAFTNAPSGSILSWRWCFYINLPIGFFALFIFCIIYKDPECDAIKIYKYWAANLIPNLKKCKTRKFYTLLLLETLVTFDMIGFLSSSGGYILTLLAFTFASGENWTWRSSIVLAFFIIGLILIMFSFIFEYTYYDKMVAMLRKKYSQNRAIDFHFDQAAPLFPQVAISNTYIGCANAAALFVILAYGCQANYVIQYFQLVFNYSALKASINFIPFMISISIVCMFCGVVMARTGHLKPFIIIGGVAAIVGNALLSIMDGASNEAEKIVFLVIASSAFGFVSQSSLISCQMQLDKEDPKYMTNFVGVTAVSNFCQTLGISIGSVISTMIFNLSFIDKAKKLDPPVTLTADDLVSYITSHFESPKAKTSNMVSSSIHNVFYFSTAIAAVSFMLSLFTSSKKSPTDKKLKKGFQDAEEDA